MKILRILFSFIFLLFFSMLFSQDNPAMGSKKVRHMLSMGPVLSFYKNHHLHTIDTKAKPGFNASYRLDIHVIKRISFITGAEFMSQGLSFKGYYKASGHTTVFDGTFPYTHEIRYNEALLPLSFKFALNREKDNNYTPYFNMGMDFRYIFKGYTVITQDASELVPYDGKTKITFENYVFAPFINTNLRATFGIQRNNRKTGKAMFMEFTYRYGLSRIHYEGKNESNNLNISNSSLGIILGVRF